MGFFGGRGNVFYNLFGIRLSNALDMGFFVITNLFGTRFFGVIMIAFFASGSSL